VPGASVMCASSTPKVPASAEPYAVRECASSIICTHSSSGCVQRALIRRQDACRRATGQQRGVDESRERRGRERRGRAVRAHLQHQHPARAEAQRRGRNGWPAAAAHH
jgi:hypothetical protein